MSLDFGGNGDFMVSSGLQLNEVDLQRDEFFINWEVKVEIEKDGLLVISFNEFNREGGLTESLAIDRSINEAKMKIQNNLGKQIDQYFSTMDDN